MPAPDLRRHITAGDGVWWGQAAAEATPLIDALLDQVGDIGPVRAFGGIGGNRRLARDLPRNLTIVSCGWSTRASSRPVQGARPRRRRHRHGAGQRRALRPLRRRALRVPARRLHPTPAAPGGDRRPRHRDALLRGQT